MSFLFIACLYHAPPTCLGVCTGLSLEIQGFLCPPDWPSQQISHCSLEHCPTKYDTFVIVREGTGEVKKRVKCTLVQALRLCRGRKAYRGG